MASPGQVFAPQEPEVVASDFPVIATSQATETRPRQGGLADYVGLPIPDFREVETLLSDIRSEQVRIRRAVTATERRQDASTSLPQDWLRHFWEADSRDRCLHLALLCENHMRNGVCCLPSCLCFLCSLPVVASAMRRWERGEAFQAAEEEWAAADPAAAEQWQHHPQ